MRTDIERPMDISYNTLFQSGGYIYMMIRSLLGFDLWDGCWTVLNIERMVSWERRPFHSFSSLCVKMYTGKTRTMWCVISLLLRQAQKKKVSGPLFIYFFALLIYQYKCGIRIGAPNSIYTVYTVSSWWLRSDFIFLFLLFHKDPKRDQ